MEMEKSHMGTMSYCFDSMDEAAHRLHLAFGASGEQGMISSYHAYSQQLIFSSYGAAIVVCRNTTGDARSAGHVLPRA